MFSVELIVAIRNYIGHTVGVTSVQLQRRVGAKREAWYSTVRAHAQMMDLVERELLEATGISMSWYDVMVNLYLAPQYSMRMSELADSVVTSRSWLTRRVDQLVNAGLVERLVSDGDGRGITARLTRQGRKEFVKLERVHSRSVDLHFGAFATDAEAVAVAAVMQRVTDNARSSRCKTE
jgi:DNA-binding MarR family transcriptional regulator